MIDLTYTEAGVAAAVLIAVGWLLCYYVWAWLADAWARTTASAAYWLDQGARVVGAVVIVGGVLYLAYRSVK